MIVSRKKLDLFRARKGLKLSELNVSKSVIQRINSHSDLKPCTVGKIADALGCDVAEILEGGEVNA